MCRNISIGGMLVGVEEPRAQGTLVRFELEIEDELSIRGLGEVIWMRPRAAERDPEMGIKFRFLEQRDRQMILKLVSQHIKERLEKKHAGDEAAPAKAASPKAPPATAAPPAAAPPGPSFPTPPTVAFPPTPGSSAFEEEPTISLEPPAPRFPTSAEPFETPLDAGALEMRPQGTEDLRQSYQPPPPARRGRSGRKRATHRRDFPLLPVVAILLLIVGAVGFLYRDALFGPPVEEPPETPPPSEPAPKATPPPPGMAPGSIEPVESGTAGKPEENLTEPPPLSLAQESPPAGSRTPPASTTRPKPPPPTPAAAPFRRVLDISWSRRPGGVRIEVKTDGSISEGRYKGFRLEGESPREVVDLYGVSQGYGTDEIRLEGAPVERIRVGYHADKKELRLVLDMRDRSSRLTRIQTEGPLIVLLID